MNRIEQIIGRAVRNFSHKDLDFEERNVEIFMYGTILGNKNEEEAADLYVYRVAEFKSIQIGSVTRVLKESSVDCVINHDQNKFTQEIMEANLKTPVTQILSNGTHLDDFKVGDAPFSPACDYMAKCDYSCRYDKSIDEARLKNDDTYNENFIMNNSEKILQRIRMLMKESFFYIKDNLIASINTPKEYPRTQIFAALTKLIDDNTEFIVDKYGRNGRLINIGEYYLFQPIELQDHNISIFDRSVPIDYKHEMINFEIKEKIDRPALRKKASAAAKEESDEEFEEKTDVEGKKVIDEFKANFEITDKYQKNKLGRVERGDDNWYKHCGIIIKKMSRVYKVPNEILIGFVVAHMIESLLYEEKLNVLNYLYSLVTVIENSVEDYAKKYFGKISIKTPHFQAIVLYNLNKRVIVILNERNKWVEAGPEDQREIAMSEEAKSELIFDKIKYNKIVGFIGYEKNNKYLVFKTKDLESSRDTGARCDESGKEKTVKKLEMFVDNRDVFDKLIFRPKLDKDGAIVVDKDNKPVEEMIGHSEMCVLLELVLRYLNDVVKKDNKKYFVTPELAIYYKLYKVS